MLEQLVLVKLLVITTHSLLRLLELVRHVHIGHSFVSYKLFVVLHLIAVLAYMVYSREILDHNCPIS